MSKSSLKKLEIPALVLSAQEGNVKALEELIRRVQKQVFALFSHLTNKKEDISDLTQEALLKMAKNISRLKDPKNFKSWLNQIITNLYYDHARKKNESFVELDENMLDEIKEKLGCDPGEKCIFSEIEKLIRASLLALPKDLRITLILREFEGLSYNDIANITNTAIGTVKSRISRARLKLQNDLKEFI